MGLGSNSDLVQPDGRRTSVRPIGAGDLGGDDEAAIGRHVPDVDEFGDREGAQCRIAIGLLVDRRFGGKQPTGDFQLAGRSGRRRRRFGLPAPDNGDRVLIRCTVDGEGRDDPESLGSVLDTASHQDFLILQKAPLGCHDLVSNRFEHHRFGLEVVGQRHR